MAVRCAVARLGAGGAAVLACFGRSPTIPITAGFVALLAGLMTGPRGAGLSDAGAAAGADPVRDMTSVLNRAGEPA